MSKPGIDGPLDQMTEVWKDIPGYEGLYQVSDCGRVRSLDRVVGHRYGGTRKMKGRVLRQARNPGGYLQVVLSKNSITRTVAIHSLVASAFIGPCPQDHEVLHGLKGQSCNKVSNIRYGTSKENSQDSINAGNTRARRCIRSDGKEYRSLTEAAKDTGCFDSEICMVCKGSIKTAGGFTWRYA